MINEGKFSSSARMSSFLTNVNKTKIESKHISISGKAKLNPASTLEQKTETYVKFSAIVCKQLRDCSRARLQNYSENKEFT